MPNKFIYELNPFWSAERKAAEFQVYRAQCKMRCIEAKLNRINLEQFDELMVLLEAAQNELFAALEVRSRLR